MDGQSHDDNGDEMDISRQTLLACQKCFEELYLICEECEIEMTHRDPVVMSNCRDFMHRYAALFMSRVTLELSWYLGKDKLTSGDMSSDVFMIESIKFTHSIDSIKHFQFLPRTLFIGLRENLQTYDQLLKLLSRLLLERNDAWFGELNELQPRQRGHKLREFFKIVNFQVDKIHSSFYLSDKDDVDTKRKLLTSTISTMIFSLANYVQGLDFTNYGEEALLEHILACQEIVKFCFGLRVYPYNGKINEKSPMSNFGVDPHKLTKQWIIALRDHELEVVSTTFLNSANTAAASAVKNTFQTFADILNMFFYEKPGMGWIGGKVCELYLDRATTWMVAFCERASATPCEFHRIAIRETIRMVVFSYIHGLCERYKNDKKFMLSEEGSEQLASDLQAISSWVDTQNVKLIPPTIVNKSEYKGCNDLTMMVRNIRMFSTSDVSSLLFCLSEAIQHFGTSSALHVYDLARLCLKIRSDVSNNERKHVLGLFSTYVEQLLKYFFLCAPLSKSHPRLSGPELLQDLFPRVGVYHCSGKKWSLEKLHESETDARLDIANLVTDACNISRIRRAGVTSEQKDSLSHRKQSSFSNKRKSCGVDGIGALRAETALDPNDDTSSSELWQLLDPSYVEPETTTQSSIEEGNGFNDFDSDYDDEYHEDPNFKGSGEENGESDYELTDERPFVDLHGCTFEELHHSLRPKVYAKKSFVPILFVNGAQTPRKSMASIRSASSQNIFKGSRDTYEDDEDDEDVCSPIPNLIAHNSDDTNCKSADHAIINNNNNSTVIDDNTSAEPTTSANNINSIESVRERSDSDGSTMTTSSAAPPKPPKPRRYSHHVESNA